MYCSVVKCSNNSKKTPDLQFFRFPKDGKRCSQWAQNSKRNDLRNKSSDYANKNLRVCSDHFEPSQILCTGRLVWNAVPTIFDKQGTRKRKLPSKPDIKPDIKPASRRVLKRVDTFVASRGLFERVDHNYASAQLNGQAEKSCSPDPVKMQVTLPVFHTHKSTQCSEAVLDPSKTEGKHSSQQVEIHCLKTKIKTLEGLLKKSSGAQSIKEAVLDPSKTKGKSSTQRVKIHRLKIKIKKLEGSLKKSSKSRSIKGIISNASKYLDNTALDFFSCQLRMGKRRKMGRRYTEQDKRMASALHNQSPRAYRFCQKIFALPNERSLRRWIEKAKGKPGCDQTTLTCLPDQTTLTCLPETQKQ